MAGQESFSLFGESMSYTDSSSAQNMYNNEEWCQLLCSLSASSQPPRSILGRDRSGSSGGSSSKASDSPPQLQSPGLVPPELPFEQNGRELGSTTTYLPMPKRLNRQQFKYDFCVFCKNNGEDETFYMSHTLKDDLGRVRCPILYKYICPICGASGPVAHTIKYCPKNRDDRYHSQYASITMLKQMRPSIGMRGQVLEIGQQRHLARQNNSSEVLHNSAWTAGASLPSLTPMIGDLINREQRDMKVRQRDFESYYNNYGLMDRQ